MRNDSRVSSVDTAPLQAQADPWLAGFCQLLDSEFALRRAELSALDDAPELHIESSSHAELTLASPAQLAQVSERHFIRAFHATTGSTPHQHVIAARLQASAQLLRKNSELSIADVAKQVGFHSRAHF